MNHGILNVLIVEDEEPIREDLALFPWDECGALLTGEAGNGREALEYCRDTWPDIVVTDITMPELDGLSLMKEVKAIRPSTQFVILTCHADFNYAQQALRLGAADYVVKAGMKDSDLKRAIDKAREALTAGRQSRRSLWRDRYWAKTAEIREFLGDGRSTEVTSELPGRLVALHCVTQRTDAIFVSRYILHQMEREEAGRWFSPGGNRYARIEREGNEETVKQKMLDRVTALQAGVAENLPYLSGEVRIFASVSEVLMAAEELVAAIRYLDTYRDHAFYEERLRVVVGEVPEAAEVTDSQWDALELELRQAERSARDLADFLGSKFLVWAQKTHIKQDQLKSMLVSRRESWKRQFEVRGTDESFWTRLSGVANLRQLASLAVGDIAAGRDEGHEKCEMRPELREARKIITREYRNPLTLDSVAERVGWSPSYLSRVFSQETGKTFKEHLTETRVARAMDVLRQPGVKVYEVAEQVGFPSYRQFSVVFKGLTGLRPKEFQKGEGHEA